MKLQHLSENITKLELVDLPYDFNYLEPVIDRKTVEFHYKVLSQGYVDRYNNREGDQNFNKAGALLHNLFWPQLTKPKRNNMPKNTVLQLITDVHKDWDNFKDTFIKTALELQGSGWCYLSTNGEIKTLKNQTWKNDVLMPIDLWEHSYDPYTLRKDYMKKIWQIINWEIVNNRLSPS